MIQIDVGKSLLDPRYVEKRTNFAIQHRMQANIYGECSLRKPNLLVTLTNGFNPSEMNYVHIPAWGRYYYKLDTTYLPGERCILHLREDVLTSHADEIYQLRCNIIRQENLTNPLLIDKQMEYKCTNYVENWLFAGQPFVGVSSASRCFVMTVIGGVAK